VINAIIHGNKRDQTKKVDVSLSARDGSIRARVRDEGDGFDQTSTPDPTSGDNLMRTSGRGILVIRAFVDSVDFKFRDGHGMEVTLEKKQTRPSVAAVDNGGIER
jgi:serine/threonine-protein kinase RsbW